MYDAGEHVGVWGHSSRCRACDGRWEAADFRTTYAERLTRRRRPNKDDMIGARVHARTARTQDFTTVRDIFGTVWSEADPKMLGRKAYWIADGRSYFLAAADALTAVFETPEESQSASASA